MEIFDLYLESSSLSYSYESPLRYPGGKRRAIKLIPQFFPKNLKTLVSPFFGGGSIELYCAAMGVKVNGYDNFEPLANFWKTLFFNPDELANEVEKHHPLSKEAFYELQEKQKSLPEGIEKAAIFYVLNRASFSGITLSGGMSPNHPRFTPASIDRLRTFQNPNVEVEQGDFRETIISHPNEFLYLDPPYLVENNLYGENGNLHREFDHQFLFEMLKNRENWILSYNNTEEIQKMYQGFRQVNPYWKYGMPKDKSPNETLIFSHDIPISDIDFDKPTVFQTALSSSVDTSFSDSERLQLECLEGIIEKGLKTFVEVGEALLEIKKEKLYRVGYATFDEYCQKRWGIGIRQSQRLIRASKVVHNLQKDDQLVVLPTSEYQIRTLAELEPEQQRQVWQEVTQNNENVTGKLVEEAVKSLNPNDATENCPSISDADIKTIQNTSLQVHFSSESYEWYTPKNIIDATIHLMGEIDLDPCSNSSVNPNVPAKKHFTKLENGLIISWNGNVYMNPPYGKEIKEWVQKLIHHYTNNDISQGIALLPARTDTEWFHLMRAYPRCFLKGRLNFSGHENAAPFPSVVFYLGNRVSQFKEAFREFGDIFRLL